MYHLAGLKQLRLLRVYLDLPYHASAPERGARYKAMQVYAKELSLPFSGSLEKIGVQMHFRNSHILWKIWNVQSRQDGRIELDPEENSHL